MILKIQCPKCNQVFSIELIKAQERITQLETQIKELKKLNPFSKLFGGE
jgi:phage FluMu protein Com